MPSDSLCDIEDLLIVSGSSSDSYGITQLHQQISNVRRRQKPTEQIYDFASTTSSLLPVALDSTYENEKSFPSVSFLPGTYTIYIQTWGCTHNSSDSEYMAGLLSQKGYTISDNKATSDLWLLNSCTVKSPAEDHFRNCVEEAQRLNKPLVVSGCVPQGQQHAAYLKGVSVIGVKQIARVVEVVEETLQGRSVRLLGAPKRLGKTVPGAPLDLPKIRKNPLIEIIAINSGCLNKCTYCKTKHARGDLRSYPVEEIVNRAKQAFDEGCVELWLTSEDLGAYGHDIGVTLPELLWKIIDIIPSNCMMRIGMTNPPYILEHLEEMAKILQQPRVYSFLHIPVQSASDSVLMDMKREYCIEDFSQIVDFLRERVPGITIATDLICGFPTETNEDFEESVDLVRKYMFPVLFINQFYPRPGTVAAKMRRLPTSTVKNRSREVSKIFQSYSTNDDKIGKRFKVLVTETASDNVHYVGHNKYYDQVLLPKVDSFGQDIMSRMVNCEVSTAGKHFLVGNVCDSPQKQNAHTYGTVPKTLQQYKTQSSYNYMYKAISLTVVFLVMLLLFAVYCRPILML